MKPPRGGTRTVYTVQYCYDYEGCSLQAVYARKAQAEAHPKGGDETVITKWTVTYDIKPKKGKRR